MAEFQARFAHLTMLAISHKLSESSCDCVVCRTDLRCIQRHSFTYFFHEHPHIFNTKLYLSALVDGELDDSWNSYLQR